MNRRGGKPGPRDPALHLGLRFDEALGRFAQTDPAEVEEAVRKAADKPPPPPTKDTKPSAPKRSD